MKRVNEEKILNDYENLSLKKEQKNEEIKQIATQFANTRGYSEEKTNEFIKYLQLSENDGLNEEEKKVFDILSNYIEEVTEADPEANNGEIVN